MSTDSGGCEAAGSGGCVCTAQALGQGGGHLGVWGHLRAQQPSLPAGTALGQAVQDGLQVLLVGADL